MVGAGQHIESLTASSSARCEASRSGSGAQRWSGRWAGQHPAWGSSGPAVFHPDCSAQPSRWMQPPAGARKAPEWRGIWAPAAHVSHPPEGAASLSTHLCESAQPVPLATSHSTRRPAWRCWRAVRAECRQPTAAEPPATQKLGRTWGRRPSARAMALQAIRLCYSSLKRGTRAAVELLGLVGHSVGQPRRYRVSLQAIEDFRDHHK